MNQLPNPSNQSPLFIMNESTILGNENIQGNQNVQGNENIQGNNNNVDKSDVKVDVTVNVVKNKSVEKTSDGCQEEDGEYEITFIFSGKAKRQEKTDLKAFEKHLREKFNAVSLTMYDVDEGSIKLFFNGTQEDLEKLENSFKSGELKDIFDIPIEDVSFVEDNKQKLALTIAGNVSYTDIVKLKSALTGVDQKEILVQKIKSNRRNFKILNLAKADLSGVDLGRANLRGANRAAKLCGANLSEADLSEANLNGADLSGADLSGANLSGANLSRANFSRADLSGSDLSGSDLSRTILSGADLSGADLSGADLILANLILANLSKVDFENSIVINAKFSSSSSLGMTIELKQELIEKGAIFEDFLEDPFLSPLKK